MPDRREAILIASTNASRPSKKRILTVCVKLFLEQGYKKTTVAQIVQQASVSNSIFQNIFRAKDGVLTELAQFMLSNQFAMARSTAGTQLPPIYVYAVETAIQMPHLISGIVTDRGVFSPFDLHRYFAGGGAGEYDTVV